MPHGQYVFSHWEGDLTGSTNPLQLVVTRPLHISAVFALHQTAPATTEEEIVITRTTRGGFCGLTGFPILILVPCILVGFKSRRKSSRWTRSGHRHHRGP